MKSYIKASMLPAMLMVMTPLYAGSNYDSALSGSKDSTDGITYIAISSKGNIISHEIAASERHFTLESAMTEGVIGEPLKALVRYRGTASKFNFYIDLNQNGKFEPESELLMTASDVTDLSKLEYVVSPTIPSGVYRARYEAEKDCDVDFFLNLRSERSNVSVDVMNGYAMGRFEEPLPADIPFGSTLHVIVRSLLPGFETENVIVRQGHNLRGEQYLNGNRQWIESSIPVNELSQVTSELGDMLVLADFEETPESEWTSIWHEEFDSPELNTESWSFHPRYSSTWNRLIARTPEGCQVANKFVDGVYESYSLPTPAEYVEAEGAETITGAIYTADKFYFQGGRVDCRLKTLPHAGNFPAFWLMPQVNTGGWPVGGEIDVWEQIDDTMIAYHTIHSGWRYKSFGAVIRDSPATGGTAYNDASLWHVYSLEWDDEQLRFYIDGNLNFTYDNQHWSDPYNEKYTEEVTWPFGKPFYIILNQSVGNGSWARNYDKDFTYRTDFDYVRVYQKKDAVNYYISGQSSISDITVDGSAEAADKKAKYYNLQGMRVDSEHLSEGIYICRQGSKARKVVVRN